MFIAGHPTARRTKDNLAQGLFGFSAVYSAQRTAKPGVYPVGASKIRVDSDGLCPPRGCRTQPGVSTPGTSNLMDSPWKGGRSAVVTMVEYCMVTPFF